MLSYINTYLQEVVSRLVETASRNDVGLARLGIAPCYDTIYPYVVDVKKSQDLLEARIGVALNMSAAAVVTAAEKSALADEILASLAPLVQESTRVHVCLTGELKEGQKLTTYMGDSAMGLPGIHPIIGETERLKVSYTGELAKEAASMDMHCRVSLHGRKEDESCSLTEDGLHQYRGKVRPMPVSIYSLPRTSKVV